MSNLTASHTETTEITETRRAGFTLIELLTVIVIIAILAALIIGASKYGLAKASVSRAKGEIHTMETALEDFKADNGYYPSQPTSPAPALSSTNVFGALTGLTGSGKKYFNFKADQLSGNKIIDPFGVEYQYVSPGVHNIATFDLWSSGPDGKSATAADQADDITNWQSH